MAHLLSHLELLIVEGCNIENEEDQTFLSNVFFFLQENYIFRTNFETRQTVLVFAKDRILVKFER